MYLKIGQQQNVTTHAQYIIRVDKTNIDYSRNKDPKSETVTWK